MPFDGYTGALQKTSLNTHRGGIGAGIEFVVGFTKVLE